MELLATGNNVKWFLPDNIADVFSVLLVFLRSLWLCCVDLTECTENLHSFTSDGIKSEAYLTLSEQFLRVAG